MTIAGQLPALSWAVFAAWGLGCILLALISLVPAARPKLSSLWYLMASELLILAIGVLPWHLPHVVLGIVLTLAGARIGYEAGQVYGRVVGRSLAWPLATSLASVTALIWNAPLGVWLIFISAMTALAAVVQILLLRDWQRTVFARYFLYPFLPYAAFVAAGRVGDAAIMVLAFLFVELFDSFSLLGGKLFGRTLLVPRLSPRKTWEGLASGALALVLSSFAIALYLGVEARQLLLLALGAAIAALVGDLTASAIKRKAGVKDYPTILPVQGGLLDIVDSWIVAAPLMMVLAAYLA